MKLESKGPAFYRQRRVGLYGQQFDHLKLRSMRTTPRSPGTAVWAEKDDPRITRVGRFIRKVRIDELPQLLERAQGRDELCRPAPRTAAVRRRSGAASCLIMPNATW